MICLQGRDQRIREYLSARNDCRVIGVDPVMVNSLIRFSDMFEEKCVESTSPEDIT